jgi:RNA polymerase sigma-70 factor (ECF subfamily)
MRLVRTGDSLAPASDARPVAQPVRDDTELLAALRSGDTSAATGFYERVRPQVDRTLRRLLGHDDPDHEDIAQHVLVELVCTIDRYRGECSLDGWVSTFTAHAVYKLIRRRRTERRLFANLTDDQVELVGARPGREPYDRDLLRRALVHLRAMDEQRAWAFVLHDVCGYDLRETAQITGVSVAAAQSRLVRGRRELQDRIQADPELARAFDREVES